MDHLAVKKNKSLKCGSAIKILSVIALVCTALSCIAYFFYYCSSQTINGERFSELTFRFPDFLSFISLLLAITPAILFVLYIFKFYNKSKATILVPIIFGLFALGMSFEILDTIIFDHKMTLEISDTDMFLYKMPFDITVGFLVDCFFGFGAYYHGIPLIIKLLVTAACILAIISALKGFNKKGFIIIAMSVCLLYEAVSLIRFLSVTIQHRIEYSRYLYLFTSPMRIVGSSLLYIALLLFGLKNKIPSVISLSPEKENA